MISLSKSGQSLAFVYDYQGRRIRKTVSGTGAYDTKFLWTGWQLAAELLNDGVTPQKVFVWGRDFSDAQGNAGGAGALLAQISGGSVSYAIPDAYGSIVGYLNSSGVLAGAVEFSPYGKGVNAYSAWQSYPIGFHGQYMDWEPGGRKRGHGLTIDKGGVCACLVTWRVRCDSSLRGLVIT